MEKYPFADLVPVMYPLREVNAAMAFAEAGPAAARGADPLSRL